MPPGLASSSALVPNHRLILSPSMKNAKTVCGDASILTSRSTALRCSTGTTFSPFLVFRSQLQPLQPHVPETLDKGLEVGEALRPRPIQPARSLAALRHEAGLLENRQMLRNGRARHVEPRCDLSRAELAGCHELENPAAPRLREGANRCFHLPIVSTILRKVQLTQH